MPAIEAKDLVHIYRHHIWDRPKTALDRLSFTVEEGEIFGYLGANGAGKTTTIKILVGLHRQNSGAATIFGTPVEKVETRRQVGFMPENPYFYEYLTAMESMIFYSALCDVPRSERKPRAEELLEFVGIADAADARVKEFSKGMRQRLGIAQALVHKPKLVILDEPMSGLDPVGRLQVREAIQRIKDDGLTVFFSSHILADVEMICDRVGMLMQGQLQAAGPIAELLETENARIEVGGEAIPDACVEALRTQAVQVMRQGARTVFTFDSRDKANTAVKALLDAGGRLTLLRPVRETLEQYFMRTTGKSRAEVGAWSGGGDK